MHIAAIVLVSLYGGLGPGVVAIVMSVLGSIYFFLEPLRSFRVEESSNYFLLGMFTVVSILVCVIGAKLRRSRQIANSAKEKAERAMTARLELLAIVSHDLKNPITAILLKKQILLKLIERGEDHLPAVRQHISSIGNSAEQMNRLIEDILDTETLESGSLKIDTKPESVNSLLKTIEDLFQPLAENKTIQLVILSEGTPATVNCDKFRVVQILSNLVGNAIKFTAEGGRVEVSAQLISDDLIQFNVCDCGPGIKTEHLLKLFDRHWQAEKTATVGHGLGLFISKGLVEAQQGSIWVESTLGKGSEFHFTLKRSRESTSLLLFQ